jgi:hypothetical protein
MIGLSGLIQFGMLLLFYYGAGRYATNFYLSFLLLSAFTAWGLEDRLHSKPRLRAVFWGA